MSEAQRIQAQLKEAIELAQAGQRTAARQLLEDIIAVDPRQELAWLWMATVSTDRQERVRFLSEVLTLNPGNARAQEAYAQLTGGTFVPPDSPPSALNAESTGEGLSLSLPLLAGIIAVGVIGVIVVLLALNSGGAADRTPTPFPTRIRTATPTRGPSPTNTYTPFPTDTPGPSPTPVDWEALPTWTQEPTSTDAPTRTPLPTRTPFATRTQAPSASDTPPPTDTPVSAATETAKATSPGDTSDSVPSTATITPFPSATGDSAADEGGGS